MLTLPRWFALPAAVCAVVLGGLLEDAPLGNMLLAILVGVFLMAGAHSFNTFLDFVWTKLDQGEVDERSRPKEYTVGQQPLSTGEMKPHEVLVNALGWYVISLVPTLILAFTVTPWILLPWTLSALTTFFYSWGKLHYLCEIALGLGFGSFSVMLGASASGSPNLFIAALAGLPFFILWGFAAEVVDQATDAEVNWKKGLRNIGGWAWRNHISPMLLALWLINVSYLVQIGLIMAGVLHPYSMLSLIATPLFAYGAAMAGDQFNRTGILLMLSGVFVHMIGLVVGQAIGG